MNASDSSPLPLARRLWVVPALSCAVSIAISVTGAAILFVSCLLSLLSGDMNIAAAGVLGGSLLAAYGGLSLLWSMARCVRNPS